MNNLFFARRAQWKHRNEDTRNRGNNYKRRSFWNKGKGWQGKGSWEVTWNKRESSSFFWNWRKRYRNNCGYKYGFRCWEQKHIWLLQCRRKYGSYWKTRLGSLRKVVKIRNGKICWPKTDSALQIRGSKANCPMDSKLGVFLAWCRRGNKNDSFSVSKMIPSNCSQNKVMA